MPLMSLNSYVNVLLWDLRNLILGVYILGFLEVYWDLRTPSYISPVWIPWTYTKIKSLTQ